MRVVLWVRFVTLKRPYRQEHLACQLGQTRAVKSYILVRTSTTFLVAMPSFGYVLAEPAPDTLDGISFARFWPNLANWYPHVVIFIQLRRSRGFTTPIIASRASPWANAQWPGSF